MICLFFDFSKEQICAAWIEGGAIILASIPLLVGARWAYKAATRETKRLEGKDRSIQRAYRSRILKVVKNLLDQVVRILDEYNEEKRQQEESSLKNPKLTTVKVDEISTISGLKKFELPNELKTEEWQNHSYLMENEVVLIIDLSSELEEYGSFQNKLQGKEREKILHDFNAPAKTQKEYVNHLSRLHTILERLKKSLEKNSPEKLPCP